MRKIEKLKRWFISAGFRSVIHLGLGVLALMIFESKFLFGAGVGIFVADNWITIGKLIKKR